MPYTPEELQELAFYQNLVNEEEQKYLVERERLQALAGISGSAYDGSLLVRGEDGSIRLFEDPYTGELYDDETTTLFVKRKVDQLKDDDFINDIIDRNITEL
tara:strand:- start:1109 stop:1414 length:306 start_codon:yes stop_codon:yes gene_type:complete